MSSRSATQRYLVAAVTACLSVFACRVHAIQATSVEPGVSSAQMSSPPGTLVNDVVEQETREIMRSAGFLRYRMHTIDAKGDQLRDVIECRDGIVARLLARDGQPLTREQDAAEQARLQAMLDSPSTTQKHFKNDQTAKKTALELVRLMPEAMLYSYALGQPQSTSGGSSPEIVVDFKPNPKWSPPTLASAALTGIQGRVWVDSRTHHLIRMEGTVFRGINVGWGIFAHVFPGGSITLEETRASDQRWIYSHFVEHITLRALMFKTYKEDSEIRTSEAQTVVPMSYGDAIHLLLASPPGR